MLWIVSVPTGGVYCASRAEVRRYDESERAMNQGEQHDVQQGQACLLDVPQPVKRRRITGKRAVQSQSP